MTAPSSTLDRRSQLEKTLAIHLQELREQIAQDIEAAHDGSSPMAKCYDIGCLDVVCSHKEDANIARGIK